MTTDDARRHADVYLGGVMHYVELDVNNLRRWLNGTTDRRLHRGTAAP